MNALQLAAALEVSDKHPELINVNNRAAAELRRLHEVNQELLKALQLAMPALDALRKQFPRSKHDDSIDVVEFARAAIAKATGEQA